jgi:hypothetical protein
MAKESRRLRTQLAKGKGDRHVLVTTDDLFTSTDSLLSEQTLISFRYVTVYLNSVYLNSGTKVISILAIVARELIRTRTATGTPLLRTTFSERIPNAL